MSRLCIKREKPKSAASSSSTPPAGHNTYNQHLSRLCVKCDKPKKCSQQQQQRITCRMTHTINMKPSGTSGNPKKKSSAWKQQVRKASLTL
jgi:hypothetical protein